MVNYYRVFCQDTLVACIRAINEADAINQAYMKTGSASAYTGSARHHYTAVKI